MNNYIDLLGLLREYKGTLKSVEVYGRVSARIPKPSNIQSSCLINEQGQFVRVDLFAINLSTYSQYLRQHGIYAPNDIYMVKGSMAAFVPINGYKYPDFYSIRGTLRFGSRTTTNFIALFDYRKTPDNKWILNPSVLSHIQLESLDSKTECYRWLEQCRINNTIVQPSEIESFPACIHKEFVQEPKSLSEQLRANLNSVEVPTKSYTTKPKFEKVNRIRVEPYSEVVKELQALLDNSKSSKAKTILNLKNNFGMEDGCNDYIKYMINGLRSYLKNKPEPAATTGRHLLTEYLKSFKGASEKYLGKQAYKFLISDFDEIAEFMLYGTNVTCDGVAWTLCRVAFGRPEKFYAGLIGIICGVPIDSMLEIEELCNEHDISISKLLNENPYMLQAISNLKYSAIEHIAFCMGFSNDSSLSSWRNISALNSYIEDTNNGSTIFNKNTMDLNKLGFYLPEAKYKNCCENGTFLSATTTLNIKYYVHNKLDKLQCSPDGFRKQGYGYYRAMTRAELQTAIKEYVESGLGVEYKDYVTSVRLLNKELYVYDRLYSLGEKETGYSPEDIDKYIDEYEQIVGFKLEDLQRQSIHLIEHHAGVTAGSAGSGKTTTSKGMTYVLEKLDPSLEFKFAAPTGKAAKRMQEVVKRKVKTQASMFCIGEDTNNLFEEDIEEQSERGIVYFLDENAMATLDLMYKTLKKIGKDAQVYLYGDFNQLPPIGKGLPFKNFLRFLPCVFLTVSKRAAEGSQITDNSNRINEFSESYNWKELDSGNDFFLVPCNEDTMYNLALSIVKYYLNKADANDLALIERTIGKRDLPLVNGLTDDDIQVVTPLQKASYRWGSTQLNKILQPLFNENRGVDKTFVYQPSIDQSYFGKYVIGDRVIHTDKNMYSMQWYGSYEDGIFEKIYGYGICNGEVGKVVGFYKASNCEFIDEDGYEPDDFKYPESLRDDSSFNDDDAWFVVVKYYDYLEDRDFYILYRCYENTCSDVRIGKSFNGEDLSRLMLFYAGTTHKLQGSQSKIIISLLGRVNFSGFITRNMMYTVYTRGEKLVFALGSVGNEKGSMLSRARTEVAEDGILTVGELI